MDFRDKNVKGDLSLFALVGVTFFQKFQVLGQIVSQSKEVDQLKMQLSWWLFENDLIDLFFKLKISSRELDHLCPCSFCQLDYPINLFLYLYDFFYIWSILLYLITRSPLIIIWSWRAKTNSQISYKLMIIQSTMIIMINSQSTFFII